MSRIDGCGGADDTFGRQGTTIVIGISRPLRGVARRDRYCRSLLALALLISACRAQDAQPSITFTKVPPADKGGPDLVDVIEGRVTGARPGHRLVLYAHSEKWWAQPGPNRPYTAIHPDSTWRSSTHLGTTPLQKASEVVVRQFKHVP